MSNSLVRRAVRQLFVPVVAGLVILGHSVSSAAQTIDPPVNVDVNCGQGDSVGSVLATYANGIGLLTICITGVCAEQITVKRSNVSIEGQGTGAGIQATAPLYGIVVTDGAHNVSVDNLTIVGGTAAAWVSRNAHAEFSNIVARQSLLGMSASDNGTMDVTASVMSNNTYGAYAIRSGVVIVRNSTIENNTVGVIGMKNGTVNLTSIMPDGATVTGVTVRNNGTGGIARSGGLVEISDARIENSGNVGLLVDSSSSVHLFGSLNGVGNTITGNGSAGVLVQKNSSIVITDANNTLTGNLFGILCQNNPSFIVPATGFGNVSGNANGNVVGCTP